MEALLVLFLLEECAATYRHKEILIDPAALPWLNPFCCSALAEVHEPAQSNRNAAHSRQSALVAAVSAISLGTESGLDLAKVLQRN